MMNNNYSESQLEQAYQKAYKAYMARENVTGVDIGYKYDGEKRTDDIVVRIHVKEKIPETSLEAAEIFPKEIDGIPVDIIQAVYKPHRELESLFQRRTRRSSMQPGLSIGHPRVSAGTFGAVVYDNASGNPCILSNWHILVGSSGASPGDPIIQPGGKVAPRLCRTTGTLNSRTKGRCCDRISRYCSRSLHRLSPI